MAGTHVAKSRDPIVDDKSDSSAVGCLDHKAVREPLAYPASFEMLSAVPMAMWFVSLLFGGKIPECSRRPAVWGGLFGLSGTKPDPVMEKPREWDK